VFFWTKWIGLLLTMTYHQKFHLETLARSVKTSLAALLVLVLAASVGTAWMFNLLVSPQLRAFNLGSAVELAGRAGGLWLGQADGQQMGGFVIPLMFAILLVLVLAALFSLKRTKPGAIRPPYLCGENIDRDKGGVEYRGPADQAVHVAVGNYYLTDFFGEDRLTLILNLTAGAIILIMFGVTV
jgi:ech hydrogenase subunit A